MPFESRAIRTFCGKSDSRHISIVLGERAGLSDPITLHNFYVPAGGDIPDPAANSKFAHKLAFLDEMHGSATLRPARSRTQHHRRRPQRGAARMRRLESQAAAHRRLAHADRVRKTPRRAEGRRLDRRRARLRSGADEALHLVELPFAGLGRRRQGPPARPHLGLARARRTRIRGEGFEGLHAAGRAPRTTCR